jgi:hypothetical protein
MIRNITRHINIRRICIAVLVGFIIWLAASGFAFGAAIILFFLSLAVLTPWIDFWQGVSNKPPSEELYRDIGRTLVGKSRPPKEPSERKEPNFDA